MFNRLLAIDPSLTCSGWALFSIGASKLVAIGKIKSITAKNPLPTRLEDLQNKIGKIFSDFSLADEDVLICESQTTMRDPKAAFKVEQVRGIFETIGRSRGVHVPGRLNPRSVQYEVIGLRGKQMSREVVKFAACQVVSRIYGKELLEMGFENTSENLKRHQDIVDAILIGSLGLSRVISAVRGNLLLSEVFGDTEI